MKTKILMITRACRPDAGGMERLSWELARELQQDPTLSVTLVAHQGSRRTSPLFVLTCIPRALHLARRHDVIYMGDPLLSLVGWLIKRLLKKPVTVTVHGLDIEYQSLIYQLYLKLFFRRFNAYFPISNYVNQLLARHRVSGRRVTINPSLGDRFFDSASTRDQLRQLLGTVQPNSRILLTVGRLVKRKGHVWFITNVLPQLPKNYVYVIAGQGPEESAIRKAATLQQVTDQVVMLGKVRDAELKILYNTVDAFVQPNIPVAGDAEGFGLVLLEAALCNRSVYASALEGITDAITHGQNGFLLPAEDERTWINSLQQFSPLPIARQYTLQNFSWPKAAERYRDELRTEAKEA